MIEEKCSNCRFYDKKEQRTYTSQSDEKLHEDDFEAGCRRYPPSRINVFGGDFVEAEVLCDFFDFPTVKSDNWCGEWRGITITKASKINGVSVKDAGLTVRTRNALMAAGIFDFEAAARMSDDALMQCENLGVRSLREIREAAALMDSSP